MGIRVTIVIDESNAEKLRNIQAKLIKSSSKSVKSLRKPVVMV